MSTRRSSSTISSLLRNVVNSSCKSSCYRTTVPSALQILLQMGISKARAEKALAATGHRGPQLATDWLLAHINDPTLDDYTPREYILYLCPTGSLKQDIEKFHSKSLEHCGWSDVHNYPPHITLCSFFQAPDECAEILSNLLMHCVEKMGSDFPRELHLTPHTSQSFIGLFVNEDENDILKRFAMLFMRECSEFVGNESGALQVISTCFPWCSSYPFMNARKVEVEPYLKNLHITLAYRFAEKDRDYLSNLMKEIDLSVKCSWELRLYSRDIRIKGNHVYKVLYPHVPQEPNKLELLVDDFVYVNDEQLKSTVDGWVEGVSWVTGCRGMLPINFIQKTAESDASTLHKCITIGFDDEEQPPNQISAPSPELINMNKVNNQMEKWERRYPIAADANSVGSLNSVNSTEDEKLLMSCKPKPKTKNPSESPEEGRKLIVVRHGERMDYTFPRWLETNFNDKYFPSDLNHPKFLPNRKPEMFLNDTSLTEIGLYQGFLVGTAIKEAGIHINNAFSSPSLRCVQTCHKILTGLGLADKVKINIEPGLFEFMSWYTTKTVHWMTLKEMVSAGFPINLDYQPVVTAEEVLLKAKNESVEKYYDRSHKVTEKILNSTQGNVLLVAHASSIDSNVRQLCGNSTPNTETFHRFLEMVPYCASTMIQEDVSNGKWAFVKPPFPGVSHTRNLVWDWQKAFDMLNSKN